MSHLFNIKSVVLIALIVLLFGLMVGQMLHVLFVATRKENRNPRGAVVYETLLLVHLLIACATVCSAYANHGTLLFRMKMISFPIEPMMWINAIALALGLALAFVHRRPVMTPELIVLTTCTPPFIEAVGTNSWFIPVLDASFFLFRVLSSLTMDIKHRNSAITQLSIGEAVKKLPEGILYTNRNGAIILMNESMRSCLQVLGLGTNLSEGSVIWPELTKRATAGNHVRDALLPEGIRLAVSPNETRLFMHDEVTLHRTLCERIIAIDVTLEEDLNERLRLANIELKESNRKLEQTPGTVGRGCRRRSVTRHENARPRLHWAANDHTPSLPRVRYRQSGNHPKRFPAYAQYHSRSCPHRTGRKRRTCRSRISLRSGRHEYPPRGDAARKPQFGKCYCWDNSRSSNQCTQAWQR